MNRTINIGIMAHVDAGKTTVTENFLYLSGAIRHIGRVDKGTTTTDFMELEQKRGMTIRAATVSFQLGDTKVNLIDTPGHMDFIGEVERTFLVLDGVVLVISAREGVQSQTRKIFSMLKRAKLPVILFVNKIDRIGVDIEDIKNQLENQLTKDICLMQKVENQELGECQVISLDKKEDLDVIKELCREGELFPVYYGAALREIGIQELLAAIEKFFPEGKKGNQEPSAYVYKIEWDERHHKKAYFRVFSGRVRVRDKMILNQGEEVLIRNLYGLESGKEVIRDEIKENDIGVLYDIPQLKSGDVLGALPEKVPSVANSKPILHIGIRPKKERDRAGLIHALEELNMEDPLLSLGIRKETKEIMVKLFGILQMEVLHDLVLERFGIEAEFLDVKTIYKIRPEQSASAQIRMWEKENLLAAGIQLWMEPLPVGSGAVYESKVSLGELPKSYQEGVKNGIMTGIREDFDYELTDIKIMFTDMDYDSVGSTPSDFRHLAPKVLQRLMEHSGTVKMEPFMKYRVLTPVGYEKKLMSVLAGIGATFERIEYFAEIMEVIGVVSYDTSKQMQTDLLHITEGKGSYEAELLEYRDILPK